MASTFFEVTVNPGKAKVWINISQVLTIRPGQPSGSRIKLTGTDYVDAIESPAEIASYANLSIIKQEPSPEEAVSDPIARRLRSSDGYGNR
ncbi:MAG TPA: hypothetical protein VHX16_09520 [Chloroflexota bacterium]|nr:hypothetical protein [Chloroflexota bacterium]